MAWTQADLDAIDAAIATGALIVKYGDKEVRYRTLNDLKQTKVLIEKDVIGRKSCSRRFGVYNKTGC